MTDRNKAVLNAAQVIEHHSEKMVHALLDDKEVGSVEKKYRVLYYIAVAITYVVADQYMLAKEYIAKAIAYLG